MAAVKLPDTQPVEKKKETVCNFSRILARCPPPPPASLIRRVGEPRDATGVGKVRVILRVANSGVIDERKGSFFKMDQKKKQVTLLEPDNKEARGETIGLDGEEEESNKRRVDVS